MNDLLAVPVVLPLLGAAVSILVGHSRVAQRAVAIAVLTALVGVSVAILVEVDRQGVLATKAGGWEQPLGIALVADRLSAMMLVVASSMLLVVLLYAIGQPGAERNHVGFQSVYLVMAAGVSAAFLTADLFNLFVAIEMMLTASYVLITLGGRLEQVRAGMTYVVISLLASMLFLVTQRLDAKILGDVVDSVAEFNQLFVLSDRTLLSGDDTFDDGNDVGQLGRRLKRLLRCLEVHASWHDAADRLDPLGKRLSVREFLLNVGVERLLDLLSTNSIEVN